MDVIGDNRERPCEDKALQRVHECRMKESCAIFPQTKSLYVYIGRAWSCCSLSNAWNEGFLVMMSCELRVQQKNAVTKRVLRKQTLWILDFSLYEKDLFTGYTEETNNYRLQKEKRGEKTSTVYLDVLFFFSAYNETNGLYSVYGVSV